MNREVASRSRLNSTIISWCHSDGYRIPQYSPSIWTIFHGKIHIFPTQNHLVYIYSHEWLINGTIFISFFPANIPYSTHTYWCPLFIYYNQKAYGGLNTVSSVSIQVVNRKFSLKRRPEVYTADHYELESAIKDLSFSVDRIENMKLLRIVWNRQNFQTILIYDLHGAHLVAPKFALTPGGRWKTPDIIHFRMNKSLMGIIWLPVIPKNDI